MLNLPGFVVTILHYTIFATCYCNLRFLSFDESEVCIYDYPDNVDFDVEESTAVCSSEESQEDYTVVDAINDSIASTDVSVMSCDSVSKYINLSITETQGNNNLCAAYATAAIMRTKKV